MQHPDVVAWGNVELGQVDPSDSLYDYRILAEGDSWFSLGAIPTSNLLLSMQTDRYAIIVNCARPGDTIMKMSRVSGNRNLKRAMSRRFGYGWDAILLSGGGNDLITDAPKIVHARRARHSEPADYVDEAALAKTLASVADGYRRIIRLRDAPGSACRGKPAIAHTYDWITPRNSPARFFPFKFKGPWLYQVLIAAKIPQRDWNPLSDYLLDRLRHTLRGLARGSDRLPGFHVVDTMDTLTPAALGEVGSSGNWMNEIHPDHDGYRMLARKISLRLRRCLDR